MDSKNLIGNLAPFKNYTDGGILTKHFKEKGERENSGTEKKQLEVNPNEMIGVKEENNIESV